jgi:fructose-bisphosphate aldolase class I
MLPTASCLAETLKQLDAPLTGERVMLKLTIPAEAGLFQPLVDSSKVLRVVALSGGFTREEACRERPRTPA